MSRMRKACTVITMCMFLCYFIVLINCTRIFTIALSGMIRLTVVITILIGTLKYATSLHRHFYQTSYRLEMETNEVEVVEKRRVPKAASFILLAQIFERYSTAGISSILLLFLNRKIGYDEDTSTAVYHAYEFSMNFFAIVGAVVADSWLGMFRTILLMSVVFAIGSITITVGVLDFLNLPLEAFSIVGLVVMSFGGGCLKPLSSTFGAQQYKVTDVKNIALFFSLYYFMYNTGSITSRLVNPILREDVKCFGNEDCFALAFGISGILMIVVALIIMVAKRYSKASPQATGTSLLDVVACIWNAIIVKIKSRKLQISKKSHWLDYSEEKYGKKLVWETRLILEVIILYLPITLFWALFFQQGSRWVFQAVRMNGDLGFYTIKPDQFNVINPLLVLILIPVFEYYIYPLLSKVGITTALQKVILGGVLAAVAFLISALLESQIDRQYLHMAWMVPQYLVMTMGEVLITIPLMNFSYTEAPSSMKSILQALRWITVGLGNLIVTIVAGSRLIDSQIYEFILFAGLMFIDMIIFWFLARRYKRVEQNRDKRTQVE